MTEKQIINKLHSLQSLNDLMAKELQVLDKELSHFHGRATRKGLAESVKATLISNRFKSIQKANSIK